MDDKDSEEGGGGVGGGDGSETGVEEVVNIDGIGVGRGTIEIGSESGEGRGGVAVLLKGIGGGRSIGLPLIHHPS